MVKHSDSLSYHEHQHFKAWDLVRVRELSELECTQGLGSGHPTFYQPRDASYSLSFNPYMAQLGNHIMRVSTVERRPYGYVYYLQHPETNESDMFTYTAYFLDVYHYPSNQAAASLLSDSVDER